MHDTGLRWLYKKDWDFDSVPDGGTYEAYTKALLICSNGDGQITEEERAWVLGLAAALDAPAPLMEELRTYPATEDVHDVLARSENAAANKRALIYDAIRACSADGSLHPDELSAIRKMNHHLDHPDELVDQYLALHEQEQRLRAERVRLTWPDPATKPF
ncbi:tellurium resistance protein [Nonomuraea zeae]|uniref:Tellurium resistance protein n=1 Tax=Nonomuraea zeae TaxID=1642303 RepID=A0A5S4GY06_9ACTN|nr:tellurium resistance protein [Nonomuraea zeae]TMR37875.1 tellurium resistance protein [Nonomuraea zeae]